MKRPAGEFADAWEVAVEAACSVWGDAVVWCQEAARIDPPPLPWPPSAAGGYVGFLATLARTGVALAIAEAAKAGIGVRVDPADAEFQLILRVVRLAVDRADKEVRERFIGRRGGGHRLADKRAFVHWVKADLVDAAVRAPGLRRDAIAATGVPKSTAYRHMKRRPA